MNNWAPFYSNSTTNSRFKKTSNNKLVNLPWLSQLVLHLSWSQVKIKTGAELSFFPKVKLKFCLFWTKFWFFHFECFAVNDNAFYDS